MTVAPRSISRFRPSLPFVLLAALLGALWLAGGASRADVAGQAIVRAAAWGSVIVAILFGRRPDLRHSRPLWLLMAVLVLLPLAQLIPLPPGIWQALPGRAPFAEAAAIIGSGQPWRPWSIVPSATLNAASSLIVPLATLLLATMVREEERQWLPGLLLCVMVVSMLMGILQFSGAALDNPLINETVGEVSGTFANRNHFALFMALGCLLAPVWAFLNGRSSGWRGPAALGMVLLFTLIILASGSRAGILLGVLALGIGLFLAYRGIRRATSRLPRWAFLAIMVGIPSMVALFVVISVVADRAVSIDRAMTVEVGRDMRTRAAPTVLAMIRTYFPAGSGLGGFDPLFRMHEPLALVKFTHFNRAHNDYLEVALDAGAAGLLLLLAGLAWWAWASYRAWRAGPETRNALPKLGSAMLLLVFIASASDYPARTPLVMATIVLAALWLSWPPPDPERGDTAVGAGALNRRHR